MSIRFSITDGTGQNLLCTLTWNNSGREFDSYSLFTYCDEECWELTKDTLYLSIIVMFLFIYFKVNKKSFYLALNC